MLKIVDIFQCDMGSVKADRKDRFIKDSALYTVGGQHPLPALVVTVAATHAGLMTRNKAFYKPDVMRAHLETFVKPYPKPVQVHHSDHVDPVGRVRATRYVDISNTYANQLRDFTKRFGSKTFIDAAVATEKGFDQVKWVLKNLQSTNGYKGLGYGELDLHITDSDTAKKILDERYLTVSVGFSTTEAYCSECKQDWAGSEGPCEHTPGQKMEDGTPMVLIPSNFLYEEVSWVNNPADPHAQVINIVKTGTPSFETVSATDAELHDLAIVPILLGVSGEGIYRLDSYKDVDVTRAQEILNVAKKTDSTQVDSAPELIEDDGVQFPKEAEVLLADAKRENWVTTETDGHMHRAIIDPVTGNGSTDWLSDHSHSIMNKVLEPNRVYDNGDEGEKEMPHVHALDKKIAPLTDNTTLDATEVEAGSCPDCNNSEMDCTCDKGLMCRGCKHLMSECACEDSICEKCAKKKKKKGSDMPHDTSSSCACEPIEPVIEDEVDITDEVIKSEDFYDKFIAPILVELEAGDATLTAEQRKGLKSNTFCGPDRSFPCPDCAHVTAARRLIGRYKGPGKKSTILACVNRKAKSMGCDKSKNAFEPLDVTLVDPKDATKEIKVRISNVDDIQVVVNTLDAEVYTVNKDKLHEVGKLLGMTPEQVDSYSKTGVAEGNETTPLEEAIAVNETKVTLEINELYADNLVKELISMDEDKRNSLVQMIRDKFIEAGLFPNYDDEYNQLIDEIDELNQKLARVTVANRDLYAAKQHLLAETIVQLKESLKKEGFDELDEAARVVKVSELTVRSIDSLNDTLQDLTSEIAGAKTTQPELDTVAGLPGSLELKEPDTKTVTEGSKVSFDTVALRDLDPQTYQLTRKLLDAFGGTPRK